MGLNQTHTFDLLSHYLKQNHSCGIKDLGYFEVKSVSSQVDPVAQLFHPMKLNLVFIEKEIGTSEEFINFCSILWNINTLQAKQRISTEALQLKYQIESNGTIQVAGLGIFSKTENATINFKFDAEHWTSGISFGLPRIRFNAAASKVKTITVDRTAKPGDIEEISQAREQALKELRLMLEQANIAESGKSSKKIGAFPIIATVLTLILLINVILFLKKNPTSSIQNEIARMDMASETGKLIVDSVHPTEEKVTDLLIKENRFNFNPGAAIRKGEVDFDSNDYFPLINLNVIPNIAEVQKELNPELKDNSTTIEVQETDETNSKELIKNSNSAPVIGTIKENHKSNLAYSLVAGAFKSKANALKLENELKSQGYQNASVLKPKNHIYFLVFYNSFNSREEAMKLQIQLESKGEEPWIFEAE